MCLSTLGILGPYYYECFVYMRDGVDLPASPAHDRVKQGYRLVQVADQYQNDWYWMNFFWLWVVPVRPLLRSDELHEAIIFMARRAQGGQLPSEE